MDDEMDRRKEEEEEEEEEEDENKEGTLKTYDTRFKPYGHYLKWFRVFPPQTHTHTQQRYVSTKPPHNTH